MWPFTRRSVLERHLLQTYTGMITVRGLPAGLAKQTAKQLLAVAKKQARSDSDLPSNFGHILLDREATDESVRQMLAKKRAEGVTDDDIRWWWGLHKLERRLLIAVDDWFRLAAFKRYRAEGLSKEQAVAQLRKAFPLFGDPNATDHAKGDDRPLPLELKERINRWVERQMADAGPQHMCEAASFSSMNALIRSEIRKGRL